MTYGKMIKNAINEKQTKSQGNYIVTYNNDNRLSNVYMFGHKIFTYDHELKTYTWDFCGYEGHPKTTRAINYCLDAVNAPYKLKTNKGNVIKVTSAF